MSVILFPALFLRRTNGYFTDELIEIFGVVLILLGQLFRVSARGYKSEYSQNGQSLLQGGPYALVRNPMYLGILLIGSGIVLVLFQWWATAALLLVFITRYILLIFKEEEKLFVTFPEDYPDYRQRVSCLIPSIAKISQMDISEYLPLKLSWLKKEIGTISAVLFITLFLESWEDIKNEGIRVYLREFIGILIIIILFICLIGYLIRRTNALEKDVANKK